ncbi:MAG: AAA family ATPase [Candidatus Heimdallarchaeota archaeon]|nr:AAA family ATPase [Candidatus Heimdallarchaeota archaeon]MCK5142734.1 AAA family ATPase [Candidatus Heimdallarchaeota archaeon]
MSAQGLIDHARDFAVKAYSFDKEKNYSEAIPHYLDAAEALMKAIKFERNPQVARSLKKKANMYISRARELRELLEKRKERKSKAGSDDEEEKLENAISDIIVTEKPNITLADIAGLETAKQTLREAIVLPLMRPDLFSGARKPWKGILLFGPPGCGKTLLAKATAAEVEATFFNVSASSIISKWLGESEKLVKQLFELADEKQPSIIFIDEVDALAGARGGEHDAMRRVKTELLTSMDGLSSSETDRIVTVGATNMPESIDGAFRRRFERRIYIPLPDLPARSAIFIFNTKGVELAEDADFEVLAEITEGYSGSDIAMVCREAIMTPIRELDMAGAIENTSIAARAVTQDDFLEAIESINPSVSDDEIEKYDNWNEEFGSA